MTIEELRKASGPIVRSSVLLACFPLATSVLAATIASLTYPGHPLTAVQLAVVFCFAGAAAIWFLLAVILAPSAFARGCKLMCPDCANHLLQHSIFARQFQQASAGIAEKL